MDVLTRWTDDGLAVLLPGASVTETRVVARRMHAAIGKAEATSATRLAVATGIAEGH